MTAKFGITKEEQAHVRAALQFLRRQIGTWEALAKTLQIGQSTLMSVISGRLPVSERVAFRTAKLAGVTVDAVLSGEYPEPGTCPYCGRGPE